MKKYAAFLLSIAMLVLVLAGCSAKGQNTPTAKWDCSVSCMEKSSPEEYVVTYSDEKVTCKTGTLTFQNRNDFDVVVHLLSDGAEESVSDVIPAGGCFSLLQIADKAYTVGVHADVDPLTEIRLFVYDGDSAEPYTK